MGDSNRTQLIEKTAKSLKLTSTRGKAIVAINIVPLALGAADGSLVLLLCGAVPLAIGLIAWVWADTLIPWRHG